jgi:hypothetical protein
VRVSASTALAAQTKSLARRRRVPGAPDDSKTTGQEFPCEPVVPTVCYRDFVRHDDYVRHRPVRSRALRLGNRNLGCSSPRDVAGETCSLQNFDSASGAKEYAQCRLPSFATHERDSPRIILIYHCHVRNAELQFVGTTCATRTLTLPSPLKCRGDPCARRFHSPSRR